VQARGAAPFFRSFQGGFRRRYRVRAETVASAIRIGDPASHDRAVRAIRETRGLVTTVTDREILEAKAVVDAAGIGCEPASAAAVAGTRRLVREGVIRRGDSVVAVLTGHVLKDPGVVMDFHSRRGPHRNPPVTVEARLSEIERLVRLRL
jgi:threonine synthase